MLKTCVICGADFDAIRAQISCSVVCSRARETAMAREHRARYPDVAAKRRKATAKYREANLDKCRAFNRAYHKAHKEEIAYRAKLHRKAHPEIRQDYEIANRDKRNAEQRERRAKAEYAIEKLKELGIEL